MHDTTKMASNCKPRTIKMKENMFWTTKRKGMDTQKMNFFWIGEATSVGPLGMDWPVTLIFECTVLYRCV